MPYGQKRHYKRRRYYKKKTYRKSRYNRRARRYLPTILPNNYTCRLKYCEEITLDASAVAPSVALFRANSLYDPYYSGSTGHQPMGFDELCLHYSHFTVLGSRIKVTPVASESATSWNSMYYGVSLTHDGASVGNMANITEILEQENHTNGVLIGNNSWLADHQFRPARKNFSLKKFFNAKDSDADQYNCTVAANPDEVAWFEVWACPVQANNPDEHKFLVEMDFIVKCHEPISQAQS